MPFSPRSTMSFETRNALTLFSFCIEVYKKRSSQSRGFRQFPGRKKMPENWAFRSKQAPLQWPLVPTWLNVRILQLMPQLTETQTVQSLRTPEVAIMT